MECLTSITAKSTCQDHDKDVVFTRDLQPATHASQKIHRRCTKKNHSRVSNNEISKRPQPFGLESDFTS